MNSKIVLTIQKQLKNLTNKKFSKKYINKKILPVINHIVSSNKKKFLIGGSQGVGKSTLVYVIKKNIQTFYNKRVLTLSLDDYYLSRKKRFSLSKKIHPLLSTRGVPGTHNIKLLIKHINQFNNSKYPINVPIFDKLIDDSLSKKRKENSKADILILEGWCCGAKQMKNNFLLKNINSLEKNQDNKYLWRKFYNNKLKYEYHELFKMFDYKIFLKASSFKYVLNWRLKQEKMNKSNLNIQKKMDKKNLINFIQHYEKLTRWMLKNHITMFDLIIKVNNKQKIIAVTKNKIN